jgi:hypothetical protein
MEKFVYLGTAKSEEAIYGHFLRALQQVREFHGNAPLKLHVTEAIREVIDGGILKDIEVRVVSPVNRRADLYLGKHIVATVQDWRTP